MEKKNKEDSSSVYEEAYSQCSYEKYQKERDSTLRSTNVDKENKYFKAEELVQNIEEEKPKTKLRSKKKKTVENNEIAKIKKEDDDYAVNGGFEDANTPEEPKERKDPMENENIKGGCCMNNNNCIIY